MSWWWPAALRSCAVTLSRKPWREKAVAVRPDCASFYFLESILMAMILWSALWWSSETDCFSRYHLCIFSSGTAVCFERTRRWPPMSCQFDYSLLHASASCQGGCAAATTVADLYLAAILRFGSRSPEFDHFPIPFERLLVNGSSRLSDHRRALDCRYCIGRSELSLAHLAILYRSGCALAPSVLASARPWTPQCSGSDSKCSREFAGSMPEMQAIFGSKRRWWMQRSNFARYPRPDLQLALSMRLFVSEVPTEWPARLYHFCDWIQVSLFCYPCLVAVRKSVSLSDWSLRSTTGALVLSNTTLPSQQSLQPLTGRTWKHRIELAIDSEWQRGPKHGVAPALWLASAQSRSCSILAASTWWCPVQYLDNRDSDRLWRSAHRFRALALPFGSLSVWASWAYPIPRIRLSWRWSGTDTAWDWQGFAR